VHRQAVDNTEKKNYTQMYIEQMGAQNEEKKNLMKKKRATIDQRQRRKKKNKYNMNNGTLFDIYS